MERLAPLEPPHFDVVSSLTVVGDTLVSGSRDKNLRSWDYDTYQQKYPDAMNAHSDWINTLETDEERSLMYSGGKEGIIKVWNPKNQRLDCVASLSGHTGGINTLCRIESTGGRVFASGSSDKSIRMWKMKDKYVTAAEPESEEDEEMAAAEESKEEERKKPAAKKQFMTL